MDGSIDVLKERLFELRMICFDCPCSCSSPWYYESACDDCCIESECMQIEDELSKY